MIKKNIKKRYHKKRDIIEEEKKIPKNEEKAKK